MPTDTVPRARLLESGAETLGGPQLELYLIYGSPRPDEVRSISQGEYCVNDR